MHGLTIEKTAQISVATNSAVPPLVTTCKMLSMMGGRRPNNQDSSCPCGQTPAFFFAQPPRSFP